MIMLKKVGHIAMRVPNPARGAQFYSDILGLEVSGRANGIEFLRCGADHHCMILYPVDHRSAWDAAIPQESGLHHIAFEVESRADLDHAREVLRDRGVTIVSGPGKCEELGVADTLRFLDPEGRCVELYADMEQIHEACASPCAIRPKKLSHFNLTSQNWETTSDFYINLLGMKVSDWITDVGVFMRCAPEYHSLVFMRAKENKVHHCMYEVENYAAFMRAAAIMKERHVPILNGPGRHGPGRALYLYCQDSEGNTFELGCEEQQIHDEDQWKPRVLHMEDARINLWEGRVPEALRQ